MVAQFDVGDALNSDPNKPDGGSDLNSDCAAVASQSARAHAQLYKNRMIP